MRTNPPFENIRNATAVPGASAPRGFAENSGAADNNNGIG
jgi:hypothetical protein